MCSAGEKKTHSQILPNAQASVGEQVILISRSHIPRLMETGRKSPALALTLSWKCKVCETGATGDLHATLPLSHHSLLQEPICSLGCLLMSWNIVTNQNASYKWQATEAGISGPSGQKRLVLKTWNSGISEFAVWARTGISHCPLANVVITAASEHTRCRKHPHRSILVPEEYSLS